MNKNEVTPVQIAIRIVIIVIIIVILLLLSFAMVRLIPTVFSSLTNLRDYFSSVFTSGEKMNVSIDKNNVSINEGVTLSYKQTGGKIEGIYTLSYSCSKISSTTYLEIERNGMKQTISCENPYYLGNASSSLAMQNVIVTPVGSVISYDQPMSLSVNHTVASSTLSYASVVLNVKGQAVDTIATSTPSATTTIKTPEKTVAPVKKPTTYRAPAHTQTYNTAPANLNVVITSAQINRSIDQGTVTFNVTNVGGRASGAWSFQAIVPRSVGDTTYQPGYQSSIPAGGTSKFTLSFDNAQAGNVIISLNGYGDQQSYYFNY